MEILIKNRKRHFAQMRQNYYNLSVVSLTKIKNNRKFVYSDEQLIAEFQSGDELAYIELVNRYRNRLLNFVFSNFGRFRYF